MIPHIGPSVTHLEIDYGTEAVVNVWYENSAIFHVRFGPAFASHVGEKVSRACKT